MKKWDKALPLVLFLLLVGAVCLCGCEKKEDPEQKPPVSQYKSQGGYTDLGNEKLSWEGINNLPKKYAGMTPYEAREAVVAFWRYCKTALWMPDARYEVYMDKDGDGVEELQRWMDPGGIYAGLPYVSTATGNIYRLMDFIDEETGVVNVTEAGKYPKIFGGMCSSGCYWAWARVMNSADYLWCNDSVYSRGYLPVAPYTYDLNMFELINDGDQGTDDICRANGEQIMFQSYANMQIADGLIAVWEENGHTMMCSVAPYVVYNDDGTINGAESYLCVTEQGGNWDPGVSPNGIAYQYEYSLDKKLTFTKLWTSCYMPFTFGELTGEDPIEETEVNFSYSGETITENQLFTARVTSNYHISDIYVYVYDQAGNEVYKHAVRARVPSTMELKVHKIVGQSYTWGSWDDLSPEESYTVKVEVLLGTGERYTVYNGQLTLDN